MKSPVVLAIIIACSIGWIHAAITLANSGYPMHGANPQRNYKVDKPIRCSSISNGKTTVLNEIWTFPAPNAAFQLHATGYDLIQNEKGFGYTVVYEEAFPKVYKINTTDGSYDSLFFYDPEDAPLMTMLAEEKFYYSGPEITYIVNSTSLQQINAVSDQGGYGVTSTMVPYKNDFMVKSRIQSDLVESNALFYFRDSTSAVDDTFANINLDFSGMTLSPVLVYKSTTSSTEIPIVIGHANQFGAPSKVASPNYNVNLPDTSVGTSMIVGEELILSYQSTAAKGIYKLDAATGDITTNKTYTNWNGNMFNLNSGQLMYHNGIALAVMSIYPQMFYVDLLSGQTIASLTDFRPVNRNFMFSNDDQTVLALGMSTRSQYFEIMGLEWDTWKVNVRGRIPTAGMDSTFGTVVIGDDCRAHVSINHVLYTLAPLPIQNVVPILECVDRNTMMGYFTYNNLGARGFSVPQVEDRNNLSPGNVPPVEEFVPGHGPYYPFSSKVLLNASDSFTWVLEDYVLSFTITPNLYCPETITIVIILTADGPFPQGFELIVRNTFVNVTGISGTRVTLVAKKRSMQQQSTLETELEIAPDPTNQEPTPAAVVQNFSQSQQGTFDQEIQNQEGAPANINLSVAGKEQSTAVTGVIPEPVAAPTTSSVPQQAPTSAPVSKPTSAASALQVISSAIIVAAMALIM